MSHYTIGAGSDRNLQDLAVTANRARSQTYRAAFTAAARVFWKKPTTHHTTPDAHPAM